MSSRRFASKILHLFAGLVLLIAVTGCQLPRTNGKDQRPCAVQADNNYWTDFSFSATVSEPPQCPVPLDSSNQHEDFVVNISAPSSEVQSTYDASLDILNANGAKELPGHETYYFFYDYRFTYGDWYANITTYYMAGTVAEPACNDLPGTPPCADTAIFRTSLDAAAGYSPPSADVKGGVDLPYTQAILATETVPSIAPGAPLTIHGSAYNGKTPLTYYWEMNGSHVGSNSQSYTLGYAVPGETYTFLLRITDVEGDTGSVDTTFTVPSSGGKQ